MSRNNTSLLVGCFQEAESQSMSILFHLLPFFLHPLWMCVLYVCLCMRECSCVCMGMQITTHFIYTFVCVSVYACLCSHTCMHVHICGICMCMGVLTHVSVYGDQQLMSGYLLQFLSHLNLWDRFSHWTCSWPFCLGWLVSKPRGSSCVCSLVLGLHACLPCPTFPWVLRIQTVFFTFTQKHFTSWANSRDFSFWDRVYQWTWSLLLRLGWQADELKESPRLHSGSKHFYNKTS